MKFSGHTYPGTVGIGGHHKDSSGGADSRVADSILQHLSPDLSAVRLCPFVPSCTIDREILFLYFMSIIKTFDNLFIIKLFTIW